MSFEDNPGRSENLQGEGQQKALQKMTRGAANTYASMFNAALFPFLLYQQSLTMATRVALGSLRAATGVAQQGMLGSSQPARQSAETAEGATRGNMQPAQQSATTDDATDRTLQQGIEVGDKIAWQDMEVINRAAQDKMRTASRAALQQNAGATEETTRESYAKMADWSPTEVDEVASGPSKPAPTPSSEVPNAMGELPPSPAAEATARPVAEAVVDETSEGSLETSSGAERAAGDETASPPSASVPTVQEESVIDEGPSPTREESPAGEGTNTIEELPPPPEVSEVDLPPPPPVPQNILDELPPPPALEALDEPTAQSARGEKPRIHVRKVTAAARRTAEELNVDLDEVEGTGRDGQISVGDVRKKAAERKP